MLSRLYVWDLYAFGWSVRVHEHCVTPIKSTRGCGGWAHALSSPTIWVRILLTSKSFQDLGYYLWKVKNMKEAVEKTRCCNKQKIHWTGYLEVIPFKATHFVYFACSSYLGLHSSRMMPEGVLNFHFRWKMFVFNYSLPRKKLLLQIPHFFPQQQQ